MKKIILLLVAVAGTLAMHAQNFVSDSVTFKEYTGKYVFPDGSPVSQIKIAFENGSLIASSDQGNSELKLIEKDVFEVVAYTGIATFKRDEKGKVTSVYIEIGEMILDGKKTEEATLR